MLQAEHLYNPLGLLVVRRLTQSRQAIHYVFDLDGNRIAEYDYDAGTGTSTLIREYIWMGDRAVGWDCDSINSASLFAASPLRSEREKRYDIQCEIEQLGLKEVRSSTSAPIVSADRQGIASQCPRGGRPVIATNDLGMKVWEASYTPFGQVRTTTGNAIALSFPGRWFQAESGLHQNRMREDLAACDQLLIVAI